MGDLESCGDLSWEDILEKPECLSDRESECPGFVPVVPIVSSVARSGNLWNLFLSQKACSLGYSYARRDEV